MRATSEASTGTVAGDPFSHHGESPGQAPQNPRLSTLHGVNPRRTSLLDTGRKAEQLSVVENKAP